MADIELVIKIPKPVYNYVKQLGSIETIDTQCVANAIFDGTPLPKGYGRLIDADKLLNSFELSDFNGDEYDCINTACQIVNSMPTIIEADKELEDGRL